MASTIKRGASPNDEKEFRGQALEKLFRAGQDLQYLLDQGYKIKGASTFVGNHYLLSERQRLALTRSVSSKAAIQSRKDRELLKIPAGSVVNIDGFNTIITLEVALSDSLLLSCMDGTIRDLAALRGTYRVIDKTERALFLMGKMLERYEIAKAVIYLDSPVSNSGRLKQKILEIWEEFRFEVQVEVIHNVDTVLEKLENVITSDAIILDKCKGWINLNKKILEEMMEDCTCIDLSDFRNKEKGRS